MIGLGITPQIQQGAFAPPAPLAQYFAPAGGRRVALAGGAGGGIVIWQEISPQHACCLLLDNNDPATRFSWRETLVAALRSVRPVGTMTVSAGWSQLQSSGSGLAGSYTGNRGIATSSTTATAVTTVTGEGTYDLAIHYTGRTSGGYVRVDIDGAQTLVNAIDDPAGLGFKAFPTYSPTDMLRRQTVTVATGLTGSHDVTLSLGGTATPGGNAILIEAVSTSANLGDPHILPPQWQPGITYAMGDEVQFAGTFYSARANGVSGAGGPTHLTGIASDGALDWRADNRPTYPAFVSVDYASEREYAVRFAVAGTPTEVGGQTHGNERLAARSILLDGQPWIPVTTGNGLSVGTSISMAEDTVWETPLNGDVATCTLTRSVTSTGVAHGVMVNCLGPQLDFEWFYAGMLPFVRWDGESQTEVFDVMIDPAEAQTVFEDYAGTNPPNLTLNDVRRIALSGDVLGRTLQYGHEAGAKGMVNNPLPALSVVLRPNLDARTASGNLDWTGKAYIAGDVTALSFGAGDAFGFYNRHVMRVF